jgi:hypothetical protein
MCLPASRVQRNASNHEHGRMQTATFTPPFIPLNASRLHDTSGRDTVHFQHSAMNGAVQKIA